MRQRLPRQQTPPAVQPPAPPVRPVLPRRRGEAGSAYVIALLVLIVLTIIGLALTLSTQLEMRIGANERTASRDFYAADSGFALSVSKALVTQDYSKGTLRMNSSVSLPGLADTVSLTPTILILQQPCNLCQINEGNSYWSDDFAVTSYGSRAGLGTAATPIAQQQATAIVNFQPWVDSTEAMKAELDLAELTKIRF